MKNIFHLLNIIFILAKNGTIPILCKYHLIPSFAYPLSVFGIFNNSSDASKIRQSLEELGPSFIKFGQTLATRPDVIGEDIAKELSKLQDKLPPFEFSEVENIIKKDLKQTISELFEEFDEVPAAAASIAQVHKAKTKDGKIVAVKILRPNIEKQFAKDIQLFYWLAKRLERREKTKRFELTKVVKLFEDTVNTELDLRLEAAAASELLETSVELDFVYVPQVNWDRTSKHVFTSEWIDGISIYETDKIKEAGFDLNVIAKNFAVMFFNQAYQHGFFHADLHPGNVFIDRKGRIALVDFGIMGRLDKETRIFVSQILHGFIQRDYDRLAQLHFDAGYVPRTKSKAKFAQGLRAIGEPIIGQPVNKISVANLLSQLFKLTEDFEMKTQPQLLLLQKTTVLVEGIGAKLNPEVNMWKLAEPWIEDWAIRNIGIEAKIKDTIKNILEFVAKELPKRISKELEKV